MVEETKPESPKKAPIVEIQEKHAQLEARMEEKFKAREEETAALKKELKDARELFEKAHSKTLEQVQKEKEAVAAASPPAAPPPEPHVIGYCDNCHTQIDATKLLVKDGKASGRTRNCPGCGNRILWDQVIGLPK